MIKPLVEQEIEKAVKSAGYQVPANFSLDQPPRREMGDFATNVAMLLRQFEPQTIPREAAEKIVNILSQSDLVSKAEVAGPGFINIFLNEELYHRELVAVLEAGPKYGRSSIGQGKKINVEYISANPTGPLHIGNARGGPIGEVLSNIFGWLGYEVTREFYVNDIGGQIERLAESIYYWYAVKVDPRINFPEGGYPGDYIKEISEQIQAEKKVDLEELTNKEELLEFFKAEGLKILISNIRRDCELLGIKFDQWSYQSEIESSGKAEETISKLIEKGATIKREGALWFKNPNDTELVDKESVLKKSDESGTITYFADDLAYHAQKFERGYDRLIDVWGANHHGHVSRFKEGMKALGYDPDLIEVVLYQYIRLKNGDEVVKMGKRFGNFVTIRQLVEAGVEPDVFKYFVLSQNANTPFDFDFALAVDTSEKNPVYYVKYAHARIASILRKAAEGEYLATPPNFALLKDAKERALYQELIKLPELVLAAGNDYQVQVLPHYAYKVAGLFHDFYTTCQVLSDDKELSSARLALVTATKHVLANTLAILGIEAPEKM